MKRWDIRAAVPKTAMTLGNSPAGVEASMRTKETGDYDFLNSVEALPYTVSVG